MRSESSTRSRRMRTLGAEVVTCGRTAATMPMPKWPRSADRAALPAQALRMSSGMAQPLRPPTPAASALGASGPAGGRASPSANGFDGTPQRGHRYGLAQHWNTRAQRAGRAVQHACATREEHEARSAVGIVVKQRGVELEPVHARHLEVADDDIEAVPGP